MAKGDLNFYGVRMKSFWLLSVLIFSLSLPALAEDKAKGGGQQGGQGGDMKGPPPLSKEDREKLAVLHEKMAACIRSQKMMRECAEEMHAGCQSIPGGRCGPGPGAGGGGRNKGGGQRGGGK